MPGGGTDRLAGSYEGVFALNGFCVFACVNVCLCFVGAEPKMMDFVKAHVFACNLTT